MKNILLITTLVFFSSCQPIVKTLAGVKNPKLENKERVKDYLVKANLDPQNNFIIKDKSSYQTVLDLFYKSFPEAILFDKDGNELIYKETTTSCNAGLFKVIPELGKNSELKKGTHQLSQVLSDYTKPLDNNQIITDDSDYYLLINWAIFAGSLNKNHVLAWENIAKENKNSKIKVIKLNMDLQESWGLKKEDLK
ncbi:hypothetical protein [Kaistella sp.]|uniref:hypothetical protein n=1 Tax=Kaistella sp. TaxID=2782235 RepID=UPI003C43B33C